jgi:MoaA/NifB/PqqE/SkfB family radical SAM enzyme
MNEKIKKIPKHNKKIEHHVLLAKIIDERGYKDINEMPRKESAEILKDLDRKFLDIKIADVLQYINVELTTKCSSMCKFCGRQLDHVKYKVDLPLETFKKLPIEEFKLIRFEGTLGDPIHYPFILEALQEVRKRRNKETNMLIFTNGNKYDEEWWSDLAKLLDFHPENKIMLGLDGLEDTHALHRRGTDFKKITKNIEAFNKAGGNTEVQMIVFKHNEHQIEELRDFCYNIGCKNFYTRVSKRYDDELQRPEMFKQKSRREKTQIEEDYGVPVICGMMHFGQCFLTVDGQVIPCFKWHPRRSFWKNDEKETQDIYWKNLPYMNLNDYDFYEILENDFLKHLKKNLQNMKECGNICRTLNDPYLEKK